jgi:arylsulfatase A-like enzyme
MSLFRLRFSSHWLGFALCCAALGATLIVTILVSAQTKPEQHPNIVLILADDLGWKDVGYQGTDFYETPNVDRLAKAGMVFTEAYASAANCAPSRAVLLSGQYGPRHGVYAVESTERGPKNLMRMIPIPNKSGLAPANVTMAEALKAAGYATGIFGKWHLGGKDGATPETQGFDASDLGERKNLANDNRAKRDELLDDLLRWFKSVNAPLPVEKNQAYLPR